MSHFKYFDNEQLKYLMPYWTEMAVPIFMIISGYVYSKAYERREVDTIKEAYCFSNVGKGIIRYTVPFTIAILCEILWMVRCGEFFNVTEMFICGGRGPGSYYFPVMIQFIFLFPIIYLLIKRMDVYGFLICGIVNFIYEILKTYYMINDDCYRLLVFRYILVISFGAYMALKMEKTRIWWKIIPFMIGFGFITVYYYCHYKPVIMTKWVGTSCLACLYILPVFSIIFEKCTFKSRLVETIGKASFNIFLVQMVYFWRFSEIAYTAISNRVIQFFLNILFCVVTGIIFYYIEKPITNSFIEEVLKLDKKISKLDIQNKITKVFYK